MASSASASSLARTAGSRRLSPLRRACSSASAPRRMASMTWVARYGRGPGRPSSRPRAAPIP
eukprot:1016726-Lingulodinium_polyedra.AAC.1